MQLLLSRIVCRMCLTIGAVIESDNPGAPPFKRRGAFLVPSLSLPAALPVLNNFLDDTTGLDVRDGIHTIKHMTAHADEQCSA